MIKSKLLRELRRIVGGEHASAGRTDAEVYSYDASLALGAPDAVLFPANTAQTAAVVRAARQAGLPCTPRGFGTNLSGGSVAPRGGAVLCLSRMNRILAIQPERRCATVQPGVTNLELQDALAPLGFFYAPDPASQKVATLGGNVGENAGGPHCVKYGVTTNHVLGMEVVLPDGEVIRLGGAALEPPGYDLRGLLVGSEGTLGVVTELMLRILPLPESVVTFLAIYDSVADAARSVSEIIAKGIVPATLEMMDAPVMRAVEESFPCGYPQDAAAVLIIEVEGPAAGLNAQAESIRDVCAANGCRSIREAKDAAERDQLWAGRRGAFGAIARIAPSFLVADCTVPRTRLPEALERGAAIAKKYGFGHGNVFHAGDGNLHPLLFFDGRDPKQMRRVHEAGHEIMQACVDLGGTITGEHGVGAEKVEAMRMVFSEDDLSFQRTLQQVFDPNGLFNPGKIIPALKERRSFSDAPRLRITEELKPGDVAEACEMVRTAFVNRTALLPVGGGRRSDFGNASDLAAIPLRSERLSAVIDYDPANQVVTFGAGMKLMAAQEALAARNQWLPLRPPLADGCTVGGMVALGACGPERLAYGAPRDRLLGLRFVDGRGRHISAGGKVVKNVAGYDVTRLLAGSAGTLGFLTELTFRVSSIPEVCRAVCARGSPQACAAAAGELLRSNIEPLFITAVPERFAAEAEGRSAEPLLSKSEIGDRRPEVWELTIGFEGFHMTVGAQTKACAALLQKAGLSAREEREYPVLKGLHAEHFDLLFGSAFLLRANLPLDSAQGFVSEAGRVFRSADVLVDFGCGRVTAGMSSLSDADWACLCTLAEKAGGHVLLEKAPADFKKRHDVFGPARPEWKLMHRLKAALDPRNVFAPGRLPGRR